MCDFGQITCESPISPSVKLEILMAVGIHLESFTSALPPPALLAGKGCRLLESGPEATPAGGGKAG